MDWRQQKYGMSYGFTTRSTTDNLDVYETFISVGLNRKKSYGDNIEIEITFDGYAPPNENGDFDIFEYEDKFKISWKLTDKIRLYNLGEISKLKGQEFYKGKIGVEISL